MEPELSMLADALDRRNLDGYLIDADGETASQRYLSGFSAPDPFLTLYTPEQTALLVSGLEYGRATAESRADVLRRYEAYDLQDRIAELGRSEARTRVITDFLAEFDVQSVAVPARFPLKTADGVRTSGVTLEVDDADVVGAVRAEKHDEEVEWIRQTQRATEAAMSRAETLIADATLASDGTLRHDGEPLTSERVRHEIEISLLRSGCALEETIVSCGADAAQPHERGSGALEAGESIIVDIFPRDTETQYFADMTRTFLRGEPTPALEAFYETTERAMQTAFDTIEAGVTGEAVHDAVCSVFADAGYPTLVEDAETDVGFIHGTGHGVGLDVHEAPRLSTGGEELQAGHVVTVEPGLYDPDVGGVRIEDLVVVTEDGFENLTEYPVDPLASADA